MRRPPLKTVRDKATRLPARKVVYGEQGLANAALASFATARWQAVQDDLVTKKGSADIYREMRHDPEIKDGLTILTAGILSKGWEIHPGVKEDDPGFAQAEEQAQFVEDVFNAMQGSLDDVLEEWWLDRLTYGTGIAEKVFELIPDGDLAGKIGYKAIKTKDPSAYWWKLDEYNNVLSLNLHILGKDIEVDADKFIVSANNPEHGQPWGTSELRAAYRWYWLKKTITQIWAIFLEKYGTPTAKGTVPLGSPQSVIDDLLGILNSIQSETAIVLPENLTAELMQANAQMTGGGFEAMISYCDKQIVKSLVLQTLTSDEGKRTGSMALGKVHEDILNILLKKLRRKLEESVDEQLVRDLIDLNFPERFYPNFSLQLDEKDLTSLTEAIFRLVSCEAVNPKESWIREYLGLPAREEIAEEPAPEPATPPAFPPKQDPNNPIVDPNNPNPKNPGTGGA